MAGVEVGRNSRLVEIFGNLEIVESFKNAKSVKKKKIEWKAKQGSHFEFLLYLNLTVMTSLSLLIGGSLARRSCRLWSLTAGPRWTTTTTTTASTSSAPAPAPTSTPTSTPASTPTPDSNTTAQTTPTTAATDSVKAFVNSLPSGAFTSTARASTLSLAMTNFNVHFGNTASITSLETLESSLISLVATPRFRSPQILSNPYNRIDLVQEWFAHTHSQLPPNIQLVLPLDAQSSTSAETTDPVPFYKYKEVARKEAKQRDLNNAAKYKERRELVKARRVLKMAGGRMRKDKD